MTNGTVEYSLRDIGSFSVLSTETLNILRERAQHLPVAAGAQLVRAGAELPGLLVVVSGQIKASRTNKDGKEHIFYVADQGGVLGFAGIAGRTKATCDIVARRDSEVVVVAFESVRKAIKSDGQFALLFADLLDQYAEYMRQKADDMSLLGSNTRLAKWLAEWVEQNFPGRGSNFMAVLPFTQSEIAAQLGTVREVISRALGVLQKEGIINVSGKRLRVLDRKRLNEYARQE